MSDTKKILFLSDVHLSISEPTRTAHFLRFLASDEFKDYPVVYILGDLFDLWIGPQHTRLMDYQDVLAALRVSTKRGQAIYFIYGNRDFLVGREFMRATGIKVLGDSAKLTLNSFQGIQGKDKRVWLTHGDLLCTDDRGYRSYRRLARSRLIKAAYQSLPGKAKYKIGQGLRGLSTQLVARKSEPERSLVMKTVKATFKRGYDVIICGHIHKAQQHSIIPGGVTPRGQIAEQRGKTLFTLGGWTSRGYYLTYDNGAFELKST